MQRNPDISTAFILTVSLFALWGLGHRLYDTLLPQFAAVFELHSYELALTKSVYAIVYFVGAIPAALCARRFGYRIGIQFGLGSLCIGAFVLYPAAVTHTFSYFLSAVIIMSWGWILLEVAANPLAASLGSIETSIQRLNVAQSLFPIGALLGVYMGRWIVSFNLTLPSERFAYSIAHPYIVIGLCVLLLAYLVSETRFPPVASERCRGLAGVTEEFSVLLSSPLFLFGIVAQFFGVLILAGTWSEGDQFFEAIFPGLAHKLGIDIFVWSLTAFAAGRSAGAVLMRWIEPAQLLAIFAVSGLVLSLVGAALGGTPGAVIIIGSSFFVSITWPTILGISIRNLGPRMKLGTALICMGGALGGVVYELLGVVWGSPPLRLAMLVPALSYVVVLTFAVVSRRAYRYADAAADHIIGELANH